MMGRIAAIFTVLLSWHAVVARANYKVLSTSRTTTLQEEIDEASAEGYRIVATTSRGGGQVVLMRRAERGATPVRYRVLGTSKIDTMEKELGEAVAEGFCYVPGSILTRTRSFGPPEIVIFLESSVDAQPNRCEYRLVGTSRTGTMENEIEQAEEEGFVVAGIVQSSELTTLLARAR